MIELNLSCPHGMNEKGMGRACGEDPVLVGDITKWVVAKAKWPVSVKISPNYGSPEILADAALKAGAKAVTLTNTMPSIQDPLPEGSPQFSVGQKDKFYSAGGGAGSILRPFALKKCSDVAKTVPIEILGSGGIISGDHALTFLQLGAGCVQVCSAV